MLRTDPNNTAARQGLERVEQGKKQYYSATRVQSRAKMIAKVDQEWEERTLGGKSGSVVQKLKSIRLPQLMLSDLPVAQALDVLRKQAKAIDGSTPDIVLQQGETPSNAQIKLELKDVPLEEALRYVTELAGMKYKVEGDRVIVAPITECATGMVTRVYKVSPDYLSFMAANTPAGAAPADPFASKSSTAPRAAGKRTAKDILAEQGIPFPEGAAVAYSPATNELVVRNTAPNMDMVETSIEALAIKPGQEGLMTLEMDIPEAGRRLHFHGPLAPQPLTLRYVSGDRQIVYSMLFMLVGAGLFYGLGRRRPVLMTLLAMLVLALGVGLITDEWQTLANAMLIGWFIAAVIAGIWKLAKSFEQGLMEGRQA